MTDVQNTNDNILRHDVVVTMSGLPSTGEQDERIELICPGEYHFRDGRHFVSYEEAIDEAATKKNTRCLLKISPKEVELVKRGEVTTHMLFAPGNPNVSVYNTPYGPITIGTNVSSLDVFEDRGLLRVDMLYTLEMNYDYAQECHLTITVTD